MQLPPPLRLLVIEDYESDYRLLLAHLKRGGLAVDAHRVHDAAGLRAALASAPWDLVISDYNLPGFGALPALAACQEARLEAPFILLSGAIGEEAAAEAMRLGAVDFVPKDRPDRLIPAIERSLGAVAERRAGKRIQAQLAAVAANLPGALFRLRTDAAGDLIAFDYLSEGARGLFGVDPAEALARPERLWERFAPGERERFIGSLAQAAGASSAWQGQFHVKGEAGPRWIQVGASPVADEGVLAWSGVATDITALKAAEASLLDSQAQLRNLTAHLERVKEEERAAIAREVHDELGGMLTAMRADVAMLGRCAAQGEPEQARLRSLEDLLTRAMRASQSIARSLRPGALDHGLVPALRWQASDFQGRHGIAVKVEANEPELVLDPDRATALFRISQEALTNIAKHARASHVDVTLFADPATVSLEIRDDGRGINPAEVDKTGSFGVFGMHERVRHLGGWLEIDGGPGRGTTLMASIPRLRTEVA